MNDRESDKEEQEILDSFERGEWKPVKKQEREIARHKRYAENTLLNDRKEGSDVLERTCGAWPGKESADSIVDETRRAFRKSMTRRRNG